MKIYFLKDDALEALRTNMSANISHYREETNQWIFDYFDDYNPFEEFKSEINSFSLEVGDKNNISLTDVNNVIALYSNMKMLSDTQATDERLWAGLCHGEFWEYLHKRWASEKTPKIQDINTRYFFGHNKKRSLITNTLSKYWWLGRLMYDSGRKDPFELLKYFEKDFSTKTLVIFSNNYMSNFSIAKGMISALLALEEDNFYIKGKTSRDVYYEASKYLNILGGTCILDYFESNEIKEMVIKYLKSL